LAILADDADKILALLSQLGERGWRVDVTTFYIFLSRPAERVLIEIAVCRRQGNQVWVPLLKIPPRFNFLLKYADLMAERAIYRNYHQHIPRHHRLAYSLIPRWLDRPLRTWLFRLNDFCGQQHYAMILPSKFIDNLTSVILYDIEFSAPSPPEDYLELIYGPNWRTPDPYWRAKNIYALDHTFFRTSDQAKYTLIK